MTRTGILDCASTRWVSLPRNSPPRPPRPCEAMAIASHLRERAALRIAFHGFQSNTTRAEQTTRRRSWLRSRSGRAPLRRLLGEALVLLRRRSRVVDRGVAIDGGRVGRGDIECRHLRAQRLASFTPALAPLAASGEPSVGIRMCLYMGGAVSSRREWHQG